MTSPFDDEDEATVVRAGLSDMYEPPAPSRLPAPPMRPRAPSAAPPPMRPRAPSMQDAPPPLRPYAASFPSPTYDFGTPDQYRFDPAPEQPWAAEPRPMSNAVPWAHEPAIAAPQPMPAPAWPASPVVASFAAAPLAASPPKPVVKTAIVGVVVQTPAWAVVYLVFMLFIAAVGAFLLTQQAQLAGHF
jgi:hypothetical protein